MLFIIRSSNPRDNPVKKWTIVDAHRGLQMDLKGQLTAGEPRKRSAVSLFLLVVKSQLTVNREQGDS